LKDMKAHSFSSVRYVCVDIRNFSCEWLFHVFRKPNCDKTTLTKPRPWTWLSILFHYCRVISLGNRVSIQIFLCLICKHDWLIDY
jgi:hypothetical protein